MNSSKTEKSESGKKKKYWRWLPKLIRHGRKKQQTEEAGGIPAGQMLMEVTSGSSGHTKKMVVDRDSDRSSHAGQIPCFLFVKKPFNF